MSDFFNELNKSIAAEFISANLDVGVYPKAVIGEGGYEERTEFMNGFNDAVKKITRAVEDGLEKFRNANQDLALLVLSDIGFLDEDKFYINLGDTFYYACADAEEVKPEEYHAVAMLFKRYGWDGAVYWASKKRNENSEIPSIQASIERVESEELKRRK